MGVVKVPLPDPNKPDGMAFVFSAGMVDPRVGKTLKDRQPMMLIQGWAAQSQLYWELGLRYHPELATKWLKGGGQFSVAQIVDEPPEISPDLTPEQAAERVLEIVGESNPEFAERIKRLRESGSPLERQKALQQFEAEIGNLRNLAEYIESKQ